MKKMILNFCTGFLVSFSLFSELLAVTFEVCEDDIVPYINATYAQRNQEAHQLIKSYSTSHITQENLQETISQLEELAHKGTQVALGCLWNMAEDKESFVENFFGSKPDIVSLEFMGYLIPLYNKEAPSEFMSNLWETMKEHKTLESLFTLSTSLAFMTVDEEEEEKKRENLKNALELLGDCEDDQENIGKEYTSRAYDLYFTKACQYGFTDLIEDYVNNALLTLEPSELNVEANVRTSALYGVLKNDPNTLSSLQTQYGVNFVLKTTNNTNQ